MSLSVVCCHLLFIMSGMYYVLVGDFGLNVGRRKDFLRGVFIRTLISSWLSRIVPFDVVSF